MRNPYIPDPLDRFRDKDARGDFDTAEEDKPSRPYCEHCTERIEGDIAFEIDPSIWLCTGCLEKTVRRIPLRVS